MDRQHSILILLFIFSGCRHDPEPVVCLSDPNYVHPNNKPVYIEYPFPENTYFALREYEMPYETPGGWNTMVSWGMRVNLLNQSWCDLTQSTSLDSYTLIQQTNECLYVFSQAPNVGGYYMDNFPLIWTLQDTNNNVVLSLEDYTAKPTMNGLLAPGDHSLNSEITIYFNFENADSCRIYLGSIEKKLNASSTSCTFTPEEMAPLECGKAHLTFELINYSDTITNGEQVSMIRANIVQRDFILNP